MNNDLKDKQFIALELTKICYGENKTCFNDDDIYDTYEINLQRLTKTIDEIDTVISLKNKINMLRKENEELKTNNREILEPFCGALLKILEECKQDMEPYVYDTLYNHIKIIKA